MFGWVDSREDGKKKWVENRRENEWGVFVSKWVKNLLKSTHSKDFGTKWVENQHPILLVAFYYVLLTFFFFFGRRKCSIDIWN